MPFGGVRSYFGADPGVVGRTFELDGTAFTVSGVMPPGFQGLGGDPAMWVPWVFSPDERANRATHVFNGLARLADGVTLDEAAAEMSGLYRNLEAEYPAENQGWTAVLRPFRDRLLGDTKQALVVVQLGALVVLLIACINIAALLAARGAERERETRLRLALGATPSRVLRHVLIESVLLSVTGGLFAVAATAAAMPFISRYELPTARPFAFTPGLDVTVSSFAVGLVILTGLVFGIGPALRASRLDSRAAIGFTVLRPPSKTRAQSVVIVSQIMLAMTLLSAGGLVLRSLAELRKADLGFDPAPMLKMAIHRPHEHDTEGERRDFQRRLLEEVRALPGVEGAASTSFLPLRHVSINLRFDIEGRPSDSTDRFNASTVIVSRGYFRTLGATLVKGRYFREGDTLEPPGAMIINETLAREYWPDEEALGKRVFFPYPDLDRDRFTVVGIVRDITYDRLSVEPSRRLYLTTEGNPYTPDLYLVVRASMDPFEVLASVRQRIQEIDPAIVVSDASPMLEVDQDSLNGPRQQTALLTVFAVLALLMAASGLYGLLAYSVSQRTRELGVRMAMGARSRDVTKLVLTRGARLTLTGVALGFVAAWAMMHFVSGLLYGLSAADPLTYSVSGIILLVTALLASYLPARRAGGIQPSVALRHE